VWAVPPAALSSCFLCGVVWFGSGFSRQCLAM
jgi:hypothetical protein